MLTMPAPEDNLVAHITIHHPNPLASQFFTLNGAYEYEADLLVAVEDLCALFDQKLKPYRVREYEDPKRWFYMFDSIFLDLKAKHVDKYNDIKDKGFEKLKVWPEYDNGKDTYNELE